MVATYLRRLLWFAVGYICYLLVIQLIILHMEGKETWIVECDGGGLA